MNNNNVTVFSLGNSSVVQYSKLIKMSFLFANLVAIRQVKEMC